MIEPFNETINLNSLISNSAHKQNKEINQKFNELRKYNKNNIESGKKFFKKRFIEMLKQQKQNNKAPNINIKTNQSKVSFSIDKIELRKKEEERKELKYSSLFTNKTDKAIFSFNIKKYDNSYQELLNTGIIKNIDEFAEFILVFPGFDKSIIGDFLAKEKSLNKGFVILKAYMQKIDFKNENFLDSLRFLLKRMNLPSDSGLILGIIDEFTKAYYEDNKTNTNFKNSDNLYLLASTIMALNTMFTRKDIKNMNMINKPQFISMNSDCDPEFLSKIYDDLEQNPIVIDNDYLELIYKREAIQGSVVSLLNIDKSNLTQRNNNPELKKDETLNEKQILDNLETIKKGDIFYKYGKDDKPHKRFFQLTDDSKQLIWYDNSSFKIFRSIKKIDISEINNVYIGINSSKLFEKFNIPLNCDQQCMSILCENETLAIQNDNEATTKKWYYALKYLINHNKIYENGQYTLNEENRKYYDSESDMKTSQLWRKDILLKWKYYRRYLEDNYDRKELRKIKENHSSDGIIEVMDENNGEDTVEIYDKYKFFEYWELGLPKFIRKKLWPIIIGNRAGITENLVEYYSKNIEILDFKQLNNLYIDYLQNKKERDEIIFSEDILMNQIINDILKIVNTKYKVEIFNTQTSPDIFANLLFKIIRIFTLYRQDIIYTKEIAYISTIFLLNSENYFQALVNMVNFILDSPGIKFIQKNEEFIKIRISFFKNLLSKYFPRLNKHLIKLDITPELYFNKWISKFFIKVFPYDILLKLWDNYIVKGEVFLFEISLTILKILENDCLGFGYGKILSNLRKIPFRTKYNEDNFFKLLYKCDLSDEYEYIKETELGYEKAILLQSYMNDKI